ncbi:helix-turn-helix transcriptional regulator [Bacillus tropicus]|uniref:helix-turn-helix transcriptional regulator n=1 Tax=Bacillus TaxID=1386 RepID=UPI000A3734F1|nr:MULTISPECIES: helix-turn-helix transcriptional regulator [Bacillus cereus group]MCU4715953.1 helix-turn-helix transcriptional regulator [Bacillus cereus]MBG9749708.1 transcriptional regulator [Bacillus thuringiensis]MBG9776608.1 transcriptional regulator [Bacillus thuringiensis]MBG9924347.1 transcriptional regulator [Bacillus thuringiensis]MEC2554552.1 helix-turn-helix transcriptional regulator [Bacillus tropicus]
MKHSILYKELAKHCGVTERYIRMIDSKERTPSMETAKKISDYLGESIEDVFFKDKSNKKFFLSKYKSKIINQNKEVS